MLKKLLEIMGVAKPEVSEPSPIEKAVEKPVVTTNELTVKATKTPKAKPKHNKAGLSKLTKAQLEEIGRSEFGIELDRRKKKDDLVAELLKEQRASNKKG